MSSFDRIVCLPTEVLDALGRHTGVFWPDDQLEPVIAQVIHAYIAQGSAAAQPADCSEAGYQWKEVFLPEGTRLRACFGGQPYFAVVQGAQVKYAEDAISPSRFANLRGSGNRNAWTAIWLRLPGNERWVRADTCRSAHQEAIARLSGATTQAGDLPPSAASELLNSRSRGSRQRRRTAGKL